MESYGLIATQSLLRKATVTSAFNANSSPNSNTLIKIIEAMGYGLFDFAKIYDSITESDIRDFLNKKSY